MTFMEPVPILKRWARLSLDMRAVLLVIAAFGARLAAANSPWGEPILFQPGDTFADAIKLPLALHVITGPLFTDPRVAHWPHFFQGYLFNNPYVLGIPIYDLPPFGLLIDLGVAKICTLGSPWLAIAISLHPNNVIFLLVEFITAPTMGRAIINQFAVGGVALALSAIALAVAHTIDPAESINAFLRGLRAYQIHYVVGGYGLKWNDSLLGAVRAIMPAAGAFNAAFLFVGVVAALSFILLAALKRITRTEGIFLVTAMCALFTPVFAEYHALVFVGPAVVLIDHAERMGWSGRRLIVWPMLAVLMASSALVHLLEPNPASLLGLAVIALGFPIAGRLLLVRQLGPSAVPTMLLGASVIALSPIGGELTNGIVVSGVLCSTCLIVMIEAWQRSPSPMELTPGRLAIAPPRHRRRA